MRSSFSVRLAAVACGIVIAGGQALACQCGASFRGKSGWEVAKLQSDGATTIFEGTLEHVELKWSVLTAKDGELVPAGISGEAFKDRRMVVIFRVKKTYKGNLGPEVQISTGLGGGDCGAAFAPELTYLVYASAQPNSGEFWVSMCSPGGWTGSSAVATELRYLRNDRPIASDLVPFRGWPAVETPAQAKLRKHGYDERKKQYESATGQICGKVIREDQTGLYTGSISFLSAEGYSPVVRPIAQVNNDGTFCSERLWPDRYVVQFVKVSDNRKLISAVYYPEVSDRTRATTVEVHAGQAQSNIIFKAPIQDAYAVRGFISADDASELNADNVSVTLVGLDGQIWYTQTVDFSGLFPLPSVKYFRADNVLPGRYVAFASVQDRGWFTTKADVRVDGHTGFITLHLVHKKEK